MEVLADYWVLCKPRVVALMLLTALVGMYLASPGWVPMPLVGASMLGIALCAASAAAVNHIIDRHIDSVMARTKNRPIASERLRPTQALVFAALLAVFGGFILYHFVNPLTAGLTIITLIGYAGIYTGYLKRATSQNIVIGGLAGAAPPLLGWVSYTNSMQPEALLLVLIIFTWTPPHFWALAIYRNSEYAKAEIPMLPVTHGIAYTKLHILLYTVLLLIVSILPTIIGMSGLLYGAAALLLGGRFLYWAWRLYTEDEPQVAMQTFRFSITYLMLLFVFLLLDHYW